jgi:hypothetical protein
LQHVKIYDTQKFNTMQFQAFLSQFLEAFLENALTYALFAFPFFLAFWVIWKKKLQSIRIQEVGPKHPYFGT